MKKIGLIIGAVLIFVLALLGAALILAFPLMWIWNWVIVDIFGISKITYWQALGIYWVCGLLFNHSSFTAKNS